MSTLSRAAKTLIFGGALALAAISAPALGDQSTIENTGSANLVSGQANVRIDPAFSTAIGRSAAYRIFLTPYGDNRGLYIALKSPLGFIVRESRGGRSTLAFDYRLVARTSTKDDARTAPVTRAMPLALSPKLRALAAGYPGSSPLERPPERRSQDSMQALPPMIQQAINRDLQMPRAH